MVAAPPAAAGQTNETAPRLSWAYTDSRDEHASHVDPTSDVPLGAWLDDKGKRHISRIYATYDLSHYAGKHVLVTNLLANESKAGNCKDRQIEVWQTAPSTKPTWDEAPDEIAKLGTIGGSAFCPGGLVLNLTDAVRRAVGAGRSRLAIELRMSKEQEKDPAFGRWLSSQYGVKLSVGYNTPPQSPTQLYNSGRPCADRESAPYLSGLTPTLSAMLRDDDAWDSLTGEFEIWPVDHPDQRTDFERALASNGWVTDANVPAGTLADNVTYAWAARLSDGTDTSAWSKTCYFTTDATVPGSAPGVSSPNYPDGGDSQGGVPATFTFTPSGVSDVAAYQYSWTELGVFGGYGVGPYNVPLWKDPFDDRADVVRATSLGGPATVSLSPPSGGPNRLSVRSIDRAGNVSPTTTYQFYVQDTSPAVTADGPVSAGVPFTLRFAPGPNVTGVLDYTYRVDSGAEQTVPAGTDSGAAVTLTFELGYHHVDVRSRSANGWVSPWQSWYQYLDTSPAVTSDVYLAGDSSTGGVGVEGRFTFSPRMPNVVAYVYSFDWGAETRIDAGPDGTATITWTPQTTGYHDIQVYAVDADGTVSDTNYDYYFTVSDVSA